MILSMVVANSLKSKIAPKLINVFLPSINHAPVK